MTNNYHCLADKLRFMIQLIKTKDLDSVSAKKNFP